MSYGEAKIWFQSDQEKVFYLVMENHQDNLPHATFCETRQLLIIVIPLVCSPLFFHVTLDYTI